MGIDSQDKPSQPAVLGYDTPAGLVTGPVQLQELIIVQSSDDELLITETKPPLQRRGKLAFVSIFVSMLLAGVSLYFMRRYFLSPAMQSMDAARDLRWGLLIWTCFWLWQTYRSAGWYLRMRRVHTLHLTSNGLALHYATAGRWICKVLERDQAQEVRAVQLHMLGNPVGYLAFGKTLDSPRLFSGCSMKEISTAAVAIQRCILATKNPDSKQPGEIASTSNASVDRRQSND